MPNSVTVVDTKLQTFVQVKDLKFQTLGNVHEKHLVTSSCGGG